MWSTKTAEKLIEKNLNSEDSEKRRLAEYLKYALDTIEYEDQVIDQLQKGGKNDNGRAD